MKTHFNGHSKTFIDVAELSKVADLLMIHNKNELARALIDTIYYFISKTECTCGVPAELSMSSRIKSIPVVCDGGKKEPDWNLKCFGQVPEKSVNDVAGPLFIFQDFRSRGTDSLP